MRIYAKASMQQERHRNNHRIPLWLIVIAALSALVILSAPFWVSIAGHDGLYHRNWISQFSEQFRDGTLYPRWMAKSFSGFGSPAFYFYPPLAYHTAGILSLLGITSVEALYHSVGFLYLIASFFTSRAYLKAIVTDKTAIHIGAFLFVIFPYRVLDLYVRNAWSEYVALTWLPLILLIAERLIASENKASWVRNTIFMAALLALTMATNIPATIIIVPGVAIYMLVIAHSRKYWKLGVALTTASVLGVIFAGIFTFPLIAFQGEMHQDSLWQFFQNSYVGYPLETALHANNRVYGLSLIFAVVFAFLGALILLRNYKAFPESSERRRAVAFIAMLFFVLFMQIPAITEPIYALPPFRYIQFATRWEILACIAIAGGAALLASYDRKKIFLISAGMVVASALIIVMVKVRYGQGPPLDQPRIEQRADPAEYLPANADRDPMLLERFYKQKSEAPYEVIGGFDKRPPTITVLSQEPDSRFYEVQSTDSVRVAFSLARFVTWKIWSGSVEIASEPDDFGRQVITVSKETRSISIQRETSAAEWYGCFATAGGLVIVLGAFLIRKRS